ETGERLRVDGCIPDEQHEPGPFRDSEQRRHAHDRLVIRLSRLARPAAAEHAEAVLDRVLFTAVRAAEPSAQYTPLLDPVGKEDEAKLRTAARTGQNIGQKEVHVAVACAGQVCYVHQSNWTCPTLCRKCGALPRPHCWRS